MFDICVSSPVCEVSCFVLQCLFVNEDCTVNQLSEESKQNSSIIMNLENEFSSQRTDQQFSVKHTLSSTTMNSSSIGVTDSNSAIFATSTANENSLDFTKFAGSGKMAHILFNNSSSFKNNESHNLAGIPAPAQQKGATKNVHNSRVLIRSRVGEGNVPFENKERPNAVEEEDVSNFPLESGLVDYCLILGAT